MAQRAEAELRAVLADAFSAAAAAAEDAPLQPDGGASVGTIAAAGRGGAAEKSGQGAEPLFAAVIRLVHMHDPKRCGREDIPWAVPSCRDGRMIFYGCHCHTTGRGAAGCCDERTHHILSLPIAYPLATHRYTRTLSDWAKDLSLTGGVHFISGGQEGGQGGGSATSFANDSRVIIVLLEGAEGSVREFIVRCGYTMDQYTSHFRAVTPPLALCVDIDAPSLAYPGCAPGSSTSTAAAAPAKSA